MPRATPKKLKTKKGRVLPEWKRMNMRADLEQRLASVMEPGEENQIPEPTDETPSEIVMSTRTEQLMVPSHREYDHRLIAHVMKGGPQRKQKLSVRVGDHQASPYVVSVGGLARKLEESAREPEFEQLDAWEAPYEVPPSMETFVSIASDLFVDRIPSALWLEQYTPGDSETAFRESYGWWSRARAPFIRWEPVLEEGEPRAESREQEDDLVVAMEALPEPEEQMTPVKDPLLLRVKHAVVEAFAKAKDREEEIITETEQSWGVPVLVPRLSPARVMVGFFGLLLVVSLPAGAVSLSRSVGSSWVEARRSGDSAASAANAALSKGVEADSWGRVSASLQETDEALNRVNALAVALSQALPQTRDAYSSARSVLQAGDKAAAAATLLSQGLDRALSEPTRYPVERIRIFKTYLDAASPLLDEANEAIGHVSAESFPIEERGKIEEASKLLGTVRDGIRELRTINELLLALVGDEHRRSYLLIFQNSTELRPTGGFMGSLAQVNLDRGEILSINVPGGGPYDFRNQLKTRALPPEPLRLVSTRWEFQDANWFPDFPASAGLIRRFWSEAGQPTVDGVIAVNLRVMQRLLQITGPIELPEYGKTITADNFWFETQKAVELEYDKEENKPKKFIGDLMPKVLERLKGSSQEDMLRLLALATDSLETKDIQVWLAREEEEALVARFGWSGRFKDSPGDSLAVIGTNIAGQKSDMLIQEHVKHDVTIKEDGRISATVTIDRQHMGKKGDLFNGVNNVTYLRVYVPQGSELVSADGFTPPAESLFKKALDGEEPHPDVVATEQKVRTGPNGVRITDEFGRTSFGGWVQLEPGQSSRTTFTYTLPFTAFDIADRLRPEGTPAPEGGARPAYLALYTSQSGKPERTIETELHTPTTWSQAWQSERISNTWDRDLVEAALFVEAKPVDVE